MALVGSDLVWARVTLCRTYPLRLYVVVLRRPLPLDIWRSVVFMYLTHSFLTPQPLQPLLLAVCGHNRHRNGTHATPESCLVRGSSALALSRGQTSYPIFHVCDGIGSQKEQMCGRARIHDVTFGAFSGCWCYYGNPGSCEGSGALLPNNPPLYVALCLMRQKCTATASCVGY